MTLEFIRFISDPPWPDIENLRKYEVLLKKFFGIADHIKLNPLRILEITVPSYLDVNFNYKVISLQDWTYGKNILSLSDYKKHTIEIREDIYINAFKGIQKDVFIIFKLIYDYINHFNFENYRRRSFMKNRNKCSY